MSFEYENHRLPTDRSQGLKSQKRVVVLSESTGFISIVQKNIGEMENVEVAVFKDVFAAIRSLIREGADLLLIDKNNAQVYGLKLDIIMEELSLTQVPIVCASWSREDNVLSFNKRYVPKSRNENSWKLILRLEDAFSVA